MTAFGYHASHEQFSPSALLGYVRQAEAAGFDCAKSSDHFHPRSERQGQSSFARSRLGAAMQATTLPFGIISAPGYRYHPAILAQAAATIAELFPRRLWLAPGSGEALNEAITGSARPDKAERNARLLECVAVMRALLAGETVTHRGRVEVIEARLYTRPAEPLPLYGAAVTPETAALVGGWADGLLTMGGDITAVRAVLEAFRGNGGEGKPVHLQHALSRAPTEAEAPADALDQWGPVAAGGDVSWRLSQPAEFDTVGRLVTEDAIRRCVAVSADLGRHRQWLADLIELDVTAVHLHCVGRNRAKFIDAFGAHILPALRSL
ncbi:TIGR03885 family FMN-dependent LLM class oxidoreductase [Devosia sp. A8/3-2]|nr:TIGR03885 family FMN-dependent LLM class oxidoreductase [Devosia sp. A8/3-2]